MQFIANCAYNAQGIKDEFKNVKLLTDTTCLIRIGYTI